MADYQREQLFKYAGELGWDRTILRRFLRRFFRCDNFDGLRTAARAAKAIKLLYGYKVTKRRRLRLPGASEA